MSTRIAAAAVVLLCFALWRPADAQQQAHQITPLGTLPADQWVQVVHGDPSVEGAPYVIRIRTHAGYVVFPHVHPEDENITVVQGTWELGMGDRYLRDELRTLEVGAYGFVRADEPHYARSRTDVVVQIHGIGPFVADFVDPVYELTADGVMVMNRWGESTVAQESPPPMCFPLDIDDRVRGPRGEGRVVGAHCSPTNRYTQFWVERADGRRYWAGAFELQLVEDEKEERGR